MDEDQQRCIDAMLAAWVAGDASSLRMAFQAAIVCGAMEASAGLRCWGAELTMTAWYVARWKELIAGEEKA